MGGRAVIEALLAGFQTSLLWICAVALMSISGIVIVVNVRRELRKARRRVKAHAVAFLVLAAVAVIYGGSKLTRNVNFPRTDIEQGYIADAGSYVTNDMVHVAFTTFLVPQDAPIFLDYWPDGSTNEEDIVTAFAATLAEFPQPLDFYFENAISNRWYCYTTWTPGPAIQTNGVWQTIWMMDRREGRDLIPIRTRIELDGERIAPPSAVQDEEDNDDE